MPRSAVATTWPLLLGMGVLMLGAGLQSTLLGVRATLEGFPTPVTGIIMSCYYVGYLFGTVARAAAAAAGRAHPRIRRARGHRLGGDSGARLFRQSGYLGRHAPAVRHVFRRHLRRGGELAQ